MTAIRQVPYKRIVNTVRAFRRLPGRRLVVLGDGPEHDGIVAAAEGASNIRLLGEVSRSELRDWFRRARAFVFAADEDFGIVPLEAQVCGTPVIALGRGCSYRPMTSSNWPRESCSSVPMTRRDRRSAPELAKRQRAMPVTLSWHTGRASYSHRRPVSSLHRHCAQTEGL